MFDIFPNGFNKGSYILISFQRALGANPVIWYITFWESWMRSCLQGYHGSSSGDHRFRDFEDRGEVTQRRGIKDRMDDGVKVEGLGFWGLAFFKRVKVQVFRFGALSFTGHLFGLQTNPEPNH